MSLARSRDFLRHVDDCAGASMQVWTIHSLLNNSKSIRDGTATDVSWSYVEPFADASIAQDDRCLLDDGITTEVDGEMMASD